MIVYMGMQLPRHLKQPQKQKRPISTRSDVISNVWYGNTAGITPSPNPRDVSRARQRRSTWLRKPLSDFSSRGQARGQPPTYAKRSVWVHFLYSCGTAPDSHRLRLFSPGIRTMGASGVPYSIVGAVYQRRWGLSKRQWSGERGPIFIGEARPLSICSSSGIL